MIVFFACPAFLVYGQSKDAMGLVFGDLKDLADSNANGELDQEEIDGIADAAFKLFEGPHSVKNRLDEIFDANRDGFLDPREIGKTWEFFGEQLLRLQRENPPLASRIDFNDDGIIDSVEVEQLSAYLFMDPITKKPHPAKGPIDRKVDFNSDGRISKEELFDFRMQIVTAVAMIQYPTDLLPEEIVKQKDSQVTKTETRKQQEAATTSTVKTEDTKTTASIGKDVEVTATIEKIFPVFHQYYDDHPIGKAVIKNKGTVTIDKISVSFIVKDYMTEKKPCKADEKLEPGKSQEIDLYALFTKSVLDISEATKALANISVNYVASGKSWTQEFIETVNFLNRNNMTWDDDNRVAAFVTANDKAVMTFRSGVVTIVDEASSAVDAKLRTAIAIHEAIRLYGIKYWSDPKSSFKDKHEKKTDVDYLQFPEQTLQLKTGDCDDLSILYAALLEASSVETAFISVPGHIYIAFELSSAPDVAKASYLKWEDLILTKDKAWVPLEVTSIKEEFLKAWETGAKEWRDANAKGTAVLIPFAAAKEKYSPVGFSSSSPTLNMPSESALVTAYKAQVQKFIDREIATRVAEIKAEIKKNGGKPESANKLGVLYAKYGMYAEAETEFAAILKASEYVPALINLGNLSFIKGDAKKAVEYFERAAKVEPDRGLVLLGLARANHELENYGDVQEAYARLKKVDSKLAQDYTYLDLRGAEATKAANMTDAYEKVEWAEK